MSAQPTILRVTLEGQEPLVVSEKHAAAIGIAFLTLTPIGRVCIAAGLLALLLAGLIGHLIACH